MKVMSKEQYDDYTPHKHRHHECPAGKSSSIKFKAEVYMAFIGLLVSSVFYVASIVTELRLVEVEVYRLCTEIKRVSSEVECKRP